MVTISMLYSYFVALNIVSEQHLFKLQTNNITFNWDILFHNKIFLEFYTWWWYFSQLMQEMYVLCFLLLSFWCHDYHDYQLFNLYLQYGTTITPEKTKQAMETIQSVLVEKLDKKFDHVEVSKLFYYIILHIVGKFLLAMWF